MTGIEVVQVECDEFLAEKLNSLKHVNILCVDISGNWCYDSIWSSGSGVIWMMFVNAF